VTRRKAQKNWEPIISDYMALPVTRRTEKRFARTIVRELSQPKLEYQMASPHPIESHPVEPETLAEKLTRLGWTDSGGHSLDWTVWNKRPTVYFASPASKATQQKE
jgi:hypothetical protein